MNGYEIPTNYFDSVDNFGKNNEKLNSSKLKPNKNPKSKEFFFPRFSPTCDVRVPHTARIFV